LGYGNLKSFLQRFSPKNIFKKKQFFSKKQKKQKTLYFPHPGFPAQRMPLGIFKKKKVAILWGGGEFAPEGVAKISFQF
jgi:hypothetical protein